MPKGGYLPLWTKDYQAYVKFAAFSGDDHPCNSSWKNKSLTEDLETEDANLARDLGFLDRYYAEIRAFLNLVEAWKRTPNSTRVQKALDDKEEELLDYGEMLLPYFYGYMGAVQSLRSVAERVNAYIDARRDVYYQDRQQQSGRCDTEIMTLVDLLAMVQSVSAKVKADWEDEVKKGPNDRYAPNSFTAYVKMRPQMLLALRGGMPALPSTPGT